LWRAIDNTKANEQTISYGRNTLILVQQNTLSSHNSVPFYVPFYVLADLIELEGNKILIREKYPEYADLLYCMWGKESTWGVNKNVRGDNGLAIGDFQIHVDKHPISYEDAMDFEKSLDYTAKLIKEGEGHLWSSYPKCLK
jgi:hypothetical protein